MFLTFLFKRQSFSHKKTRCVEFSRVSVFAEVYFTKASYLLATSAQFTTFQKADM